VVKAFVHALVRSQYCVMVKARILKKGMFCEDIEQPFVFEDQA
jgi:hypothetical protein